MKELGDAINESLSDSEQISEVVSRIKEGGYDIFLVLEATIGVSKQGEKSPDKTSLVTTLSTNPEFKINDQDLKFLKSLRIKEGGYDIFLVLEATIGVSKQGEKSPDKTSLVTTLSTNPEFKINDQDLKFLKSLRIKIDEEKLEKDKPDKDK